MSRKMLLGVDNIVVDPSLQSRVMTSLERSKQYAENIETWIESDPIVVFWDGNEYLLADGFHRHDAARRKGLKDIWCDVYEGGRKEAAIYSASANLKHGAESNGLPAGASDRQKSAWMLFREVPDSLSWKLVEIAKATGVTAGTASKYIVKFCEKTGIRIPTAVNRRRARASGKVVPGKRGAAPNIRCQHRKSVRRDGSIGITKRYFVNINGIRKYIGNNEQDAKRKRDELLNGRKSPDLVIHELMSLHGLPIEIDRQCEDPFEWVSEQTTSAFHVIRKMIRDRKNSRDEMRIFQDRLLGWIAGLRELKFHEEETATCEQRKEQCNAEQRRER